MPSTKVARRDGAGRNVETIGARLSHALNDLLSRAGVASRLGKQYGGRRDIYATAGYRTVLAWEDYYGRYERGGVAGRIIDMMPNTTWRDAPEIVEDGFSNANPSRFMQEFEIMAKRLDLWRKFNRADKLSRIGAYSVMFFGTPLTEDMALSQPQAGKIIGGLKGLRFMSVYSEPNAVVKELDLDPASARFGLPELYDVTFARPQGGTSSKKGKKEEGVSARPVHASRLLHVAEFTLEDDIYSMPALQRVFNLLHDLDKITASTGEAYWQLAARILHASMSETAEELNAEERTAALEQLEDVVHELRRIILDKGMDVEWLESTPPDPSNAADLFLTLISSASGYPKRVLFGTEKSSEGLEQDIRNYHGTIGERRQTFATPLVRGWIDRVVEWGIITPPTKPYEITWPPLIVQSDAEQAKANLDRARTAKEMTPMDGDPSDVSWVDEDGNVWLRETPQVIESVTE